MTFLYNSPEILEFINKTAQDNGWDADVLKNYNSLIQTLRNQAGVLFITPENKETYDRWNNIKKDLGEEALSKQLKENSKSFIAAEQIINQLEGLTKSKFDQQAIYSKINELYDLYNSAIKPRINGWVYQSYPALFETYQKAARPFLQAVSGIKSLVGDLQSLDLSEQHGEALASVSQMLKSKYQQISNGRDILGAIKGLFTGQMSDKEKALLYTSNLFQFVEKLQNLAIENNYPLIPNAGKRVIDYINTNNSVFDPGFSRQTIDTVNRLIADSKRAAEENSVRDQNLNKIKEILLNKLTNEAMANSVPITNVSGKEDPKFNDIDDCFSYIKYLSLNQFTVDNKPVVKNTKEEADKDYRKIDLKGKIDTSGLQNTILYFSPSLLSKALFDLKYKAAQSKNRLFIDLVNNLVHDSNEQFSVNVEPDDAITGRYDELDGIKNPLLLNMYTSGPYKITVDNLKDKDSFDKWVNQLRVKVKDIAQPQSVKEEPSLYCKVLNYLLYRAQNSDKKSKPYESLVSKLMTQTHCAVDSNFWKGDTSEEDDNKEDTSQGSANQKQDGNKGTGSRSPAEANEARLQAANLGNVAATSLPFQDKNVSIIRYINFAKSIKDFSVYLAKEHLSTNNKDVSYNYASVAQNAEALYQEINQFKSTYIQLNNFTIASGNELKTSLNIATENARLSIAAANGLLDLFTKTKNLISAFGEMVNLETKPGLKSAIDEQYSFYTQHIRAISDATTLLKEQMRSIRQ